MLEPAHDRLGRLGGRQLTLARKPGIGKPLERLVARRVDHDPAAFDEDHAVARVQHAVGPLLRRDDRGTARARQLDRDRRAVRIELGCRLVEQQQPRLEREHGGEADALELATRELGHPPLGQVPRPHRRQSLGGPRPDPRRRHPEVLEAELDLGGNAGEDDLVLGILEQGRDGPGEI